MSRARPCPAIRCNRCSPAASPTLRTASPSAAGATAIAAVAVDTALQWSWVKGRGSGADGEAVVAVEPLRPGRLARLTRTRTSEDWWWPWAWGADVGKGGKCR